MKSSKAIITQHFTLILLFQVGTILALSLPQLEPYRDEAKTALLLPDDTLWIGLLAVLVAITLFSFFRLRKKIAEPLRRLVSQTQTSATFFAFKTKSATEEIDELKHYIEGQALKFDEMEQEVQRMEGEVERVVSVSRIDPDEYETLVEDLSKAKSEVESLKRAIEYQQQDRQRLENSLNLTEKALRQSKRDYDDLFQQKESSEDERQVQTRLMQDRIKGSLIIINNLSRRLSESWAETTPAEMRDAFKEINRESQVHIGELREEMTHSR